VTSVTGLPLDVGRIRADNNDVSAPASLPGVDKAALAFSVLPTRCAETVTSRLTVAERIRLRDGLARVRDADDRLRLDAFRDLAIAVDRGFQWPRPSLHDESDCPFIAAVESHPRQRVIDIFERVATREALEIAVTMCHLKADMREEVWAALTMNAQGAIVPALEEVHSVSTVRTRAYARDINIRLSRAIRFSRSVPA
jgi:hypothetical protein